MSDTNGGFVHSTHCQLPGHIWYLQVEILLQLGLNMVKRRRSYHVIYKWNKAFCFWIPVNTVMNPVFLNGYWGGWKACLNVISNLQIPEEVSVWNVVMHHQIVKWNKNAIFKEILYTYENFTFPKLKYWIYEKGRMYSNLWPNSGGAPNYWIICVIVLTNQHRSTCQGSQWVGRARAMLHKQPYWCLMFRDVRCPIWKGVKVSCPVVMPQVW